MELISLGFGRQLGRTPLGFIPSRKPNLEAWYRYNSGLTVTGSGISQWDDISGKDRHATQSTDASRPNKEADGSALCDGVDDFLDGGIVTISQPHTVYALVKLITWTASDVIIGFGGGTNRFIYQAGVSPQIQLNNGTLLGSISPTLGGYNIICAVSNGASSVLQLDNGTPVTGDAGASAIGRIVIGSNNLVGNFAHAQYKEYIHNQKIVL